MFARRSKGLIVTLCAVALVLTPVKGKEPPSPGSVGKLLAEQGYTAIPLTPTLGVGAFLVRVNLDGHDFTLVIDTGAADAFNMTKAAGKVLGIRSDTDEFTNEPFSSSISTKKYGRGAVRKARVGEEYLSEWNYSAIALDSFTAPHRIHDPKTGKEVSVEADGLLGQEFLLANAAVIDHDSATLYVIPLAKKDGPKLDGRWECVGGERDGKPLTDLSERWIEFNGDATELNLDGQTVKGTRLLHRLGTSRLLFVGAEAKGQLTKSIIRGIYDVSGDQLKLCSVDETISPKVMSWDGITPPSKFEAKAKSGHVLYEFKRVKADPPKK